MLNHVWGCCCGIPATCGSVPWSDDIYVPGPLSSPEIVLTRMAVKFQNWSSIYAEITYLGVSSGAVPPPSDSTWNVHFIPDAFSRTMEVRAQLHGFTTNQIQYNLNNNADTTTVAGHLVAGDTLKFEFVRNDLANRMSSDFTNNIYLNGVLQISAPNPPATVLDAWGFCQNSFDTDAYYSGFTHTIEFEELRVTTVYAP